MTESDEIKKIPIDTITKMKQINPGRHLSDVLQGLIENSIDALCDEIKIYLENDGLTSIKVIDDGIGIPKSSLPNACRFHCTSKIQEITKTEIVHGKSFGFTGSFLANLSCVSTIKISSKYHREDRGNYGIYEYNIMTKSGELPEIDKGTRVEILNYLSNFPQQRIKIRKNEKEINKMINTIAKYSTVYSWIKFEVVINDLTYMKTQGNADFFTNLAKVHYFQEPLKMFIVNSYENVDQNTEIIVFLANPKCNYMSMSNIILRAIFLNGRLVSAPSLKRAINELYMEIMRTMNNFVKMPYFIFIKTAELYTNDIFDENITEDDIIEDPENSETIKEERCYYQKGKYFKFVDKLKHEIYQTIFDNIQAKDLQILNEVQRLEGRLIGEHLRNPPRLKDINKIFYSLSSIPPSTQQQQQSHHKHREGLQTQSSIPTLQQTTMPNILVQPLSIQAQQNQNQPHSSYLTTTRIPTQNLQDQQQQKQQSQSQSPFLSASRISSSNALQDQQMQQVQGKSTTILTPKHTVHTVAKSPIVKKSISPATSTVFVSQQLQQPPSSSSSTRETNSSISSIAAPLQTQNLLNPVSVSRVLHNNNNNDQKPQKIQVQVQAPQKSASRVTDINDLLTTNSNPAPQQIQQTQKVQAVTKRVVVRKRTAAPITIVAGQNKTGGTTGAAGVASGGQSSTQNAAGNQTQQVTQSSQSNVQTAPVIRFHKVGQPPKPPS